MRKELDRTKPSSMPSAPLGPDEILPEYDFTAAAPNKYASRFAAGGAAGMPESRMAAARGKRGVARRERKREGELG